MIVARNIDVISLRTAISFQHIFVDIYCRVTARIFHGAVIKIDRNALILFGVDLDSSARSECAIVKCCLLRRVHPDCILAFNCFKRCVFKHSTVISPESSPSYDFTFINYCIIGPDKAKFSIRVRSWAGTKRHILEGNGACTVKAVVTSILSGLIRVGYICTDIPRRFVGALTNKGQVLVPGHAGTVNLVQSIVAHAQFDGIAAFRSFYCFLKIRVAFACSPKCHIRRCAFTASTLIRKCHHRKHLKHHDNRQQRCKDPVLLFLFHCLFFLSFFISRFLCMI